MLCRALKISWQRGLIMFRAFLLLAFLLPTPGQAAQMDPSTLHGKVMCGYQGWFNTPGDGMELGWTHWGKGRRKEMGPGNVTVDLWPDVSDLDPAQRYQTAFRHADGRAAEVFSSADRKTVLKHFEWMETYGIDGVFLQRFANGIGRSDQMRHKNVVLENVRKGAERSGRVYAVMYDLSGLREGGTQRVINDWKRLKQDRKVTGDTTYLHHEGKPVVAVWGVGFNDDRKYTLKECGALIDFLKADGCSVMLGVPTGWREQDRDAVKDPQLHEILRKADVLSPWTIGRYRSPRQASGHAERVWSPDIEWCESRQIDFLPVVFPGFSWFNLHGGELNQIPRLKGDFLWSQLVGAKRSGAKMIYVAMFDEVDEGTAIFKCSNDPPSGEGVSFIDYEGLSTDHYLWLTGQGARLLRDEIPVTDHQPARKGKP